MGFRDPFWIWMFIFQVAVWCGLAIFLFGPRRHRMYIRLFHKHRLQWIVAAMSGLVFWPGILLVQAARPGPWVRPGRLDPFWIMPAFLMAWGLWLGVMEFVARRAGEPDFRKWRRTIPLQPDLT